jgi:anti-anti-sigma regulatory factor
MIERTEEFGETVTTRHRIKELKDEYQAENKVVLDFSETEFISRAAADELYNSSFSMKISEPVKRMLSVVASSR